MNTRASRVISDTSFSVSPSVHASCSLPACAAWLVCINCVVSVCHCNHRCMAVLDWWSDVGGHETHGLGVNNTFKLINATSIGSIAPAASGG